MYDKKTAHLSVVSQGFLLLGHGEEHLCRKPTLIMNISPKNMNNWMTTIPLNPRVCQDHLH